MFFVFQSVALGLLIQTAFAHPHSYHDSEDWPWPPFPWTAPWWSIFPGLPISSQAAASSTAPVPTVLPAFGPSFIFSSNSTSLASGPTILSTITVHSSISIKVTASPSTTQSSAALTSAATSSTPVTTESVIVVPLPSSTANSTPSSSTGTPGGKGTWWKPAVGTTWQIELSGKVNDTSANYEVFDLDLYDNPTSTIDALHSLGKKVICYFSAGTYEDWRADAKNFTKSDLGSSVEGWSGEWWVDTKSNNVRDIMTARTKLAASKGCDGVDPDNVDAYNNKNGLNLTQADATDYVTFLAGTAHNESLAIGLKNAGDIVGSVLDLMEWQVNEQCIEYSECDSFTPFTKAGKPVFHIEYPSDSPSVSSSNEAKYCAAPSGFSSVLKNMNLDAWIEPCPQS